MQPIQSIDDPRIAPYRNLRDRTLRGESIFVTEGAVLTRRLLASPYQAESVFVSHEFAEEFARLAPAGVPLYVAPEPLLLEVVGFPFHRGVLGAGRRASRYSLEDMAGKDHRAPLRLIVCPEITKPENIGLIFRTAAGLGIDGVLLGQRCCDPFSRRCLRVSMGAVLNLPFVKSADLSADLHALKDRWRVELLAAVLDEQAERLCEVQWPLRAGVVFGNEFDGLRAEWLAQCPRQITIPMQPRTDSLNLGVAAGIVMYEMMLAARERGPDCRAKI
jgi:tRNA G18 (ribose-2'-O)-methylase SpoU